MRNFVNQLLMLVAGAFLLVPASVVADSLTSLLPDNQSYNAAHEPLTIDVDPTDPRDQAFLNQLNQPGEIFGQVVIGIGDVGSRRLRDGFGEWLTAMLPQVVERNACASRNQPFVVKILDYNVLDSTVIPNAAGETLVDPICGQIEEFLTPLRLQNHGDLPLPISFIARGSGGVVLKNAIHRGRRNGRCRFQPNETVRFLYLHSPDEGWEIHPISYPSKHHGAYQDLARGSDAMRLFLNRNVLGQPNCNVDQASTDIGSFLSCGDEIYYSVSTTRAETYNPFEGFGAGDREWLWWNPLEHLWQRYLLDNNKQLRKNVAWFINMHRAYLGYGAVIYHHEPKFCFTECSARTARQYTYLPCLEVNRVSPNEADPQRWVNFLESLLGLDERYNYGRGTPPVVSQDLLSQTFDVTRVNPPNQNRNLCGNGRADPGEVCGDTGVDCPTGQNCYNCQCVDEGPPICGDGERHSSEQCGEPGLPQCPDFVTCQGQVYPSICNSQCQCVPNVPPGDECSSRSRSHLSFGSVVSTGFE